MGRGDDGLLRPAVKGQLVFMILAVRDNLDADLGVLAGRGLEVFDKVGRGGVGREEILFLNKLAGQLADQDTQGLGILGPVDRGEASAVRCLEKQLGPDRAVVIRTDLVEFREGQFEAVDAGFGNVTEGGEVGLRFHMLGKKVFDCGSQEDAAVCEAENGADNLGDFFFH